MFQASSSVKNLKIVIVNKVFIGALETLHRDLKDISWSQFVFGPDNKWVKKEKVFKRFHLRIPSSLMIEWKEFTRLHLKISVLT